MSLDPRHFALIVSIEECSADTIYYTERSVIHLNIYIYMYVYIYICVCVCVIIQVQDSSIVIWWWIGPWDSKSLRKFYSSLVSLYLIRGGAIHWVGNSCYCIAGWWYTYPSEKYESQLGWLFAIYRKIKHVPNHQPDWLGCHLAETDDMDVPYWTDFSSTSPSPRLGLPLCVGIS